MAFLVDANVLSEPTRIAPDRNVLSWLQANESRLVVDPIVIGEIRAGILAQPAGRKRQRLEVWFQAVVRAIECVPLTGEVGLRWAGLVSDLRKKGRSLPLLDSLIAATALTYGLTVATRNTADFARAGVRVVNPFSAT